MATSSTIPTAKTALVALISAALPGVQVVYGRPADSELARECVYVGDATGVQRIPTMRAGRKPREETYSVEVIVAVLLERGNTTDAESRAFTLLAECEDVVADDSTLGIASASGFFQAVAGSLDSVADLTAEGPACVIRWNVDCKARLS
jgi:hypothetical protein